MTSRSNVLAIGTETSEIRDEAMVSKNRKAFFESDFEKHMHKILLNGGKPQANIQEDKVERFSVNEVKKNGQFYYEFGEQSSIKGWITNGPAFEPKGILTRIKNKISKEQWITDNVARYSRDSRCFIQKTVCDSLHEEQLEIYKYLTYLNENSK